MVIEGNKLVASLHAELNNRDGDFIVMDNLNFWTFENEKFKTLRVYMDTHPVRQALSRVLDESAGESTIE